MPKNPLQWWAEAPDLVKRTVSAAVLIALGASAVSGDAPTLEPRVQRLEASVDSTHERRLRDVERWRDIDQLATRYTVCRFQREDRGLDPRACDVLIERYESLFTPAEGGR